MKRRELITNVLLGAFGAYGQSVLLGHTLESYPYKILNYPPARYYFLSGWAIAAVSPILSIIALHVFKGTRPPFVTAIPVVACPLIFFLLFRLVFALSGYHYAPVKPSDLVATSDTESDFRQMVLLLTGLGFVIGSLCGVVIQRVYEWRSGWKRI